MTLKVKRHLQFILAFLHITGATVFCLGISVISGYVAHRDKLHTWIKGSTPVALPTAIGFLLVGISLLLIHHVLYKHQAKFDEKI